MTLTDTSLTTPTGVLGALRRPGTGTPLVLLHGAMADAQAWTAVAEALDPSRPLLLPTRRGRRPSVATGPSYSLEQEIDDLLGWIGSLDAQVDLVAHSFGGLVAASAATRGAPVRSLLLYEPVVWPFGERALPELEEAHAWDDLDLAAELVNTRISGYSDEHVAALRDSPAWSRLCELAAPLVDELHALRSHGSDIARLTDLTVPTLLVAGETSRHRDPYGPAMDRYLEAIDDLDVQVLPGEDHIAHVTAPTELANVIERWVSDPRHDVAER